MKKIITLVCCLPVFTIANAQINDNIYPFLNQGLTKDEQDDVAVPVCLSTSGIAIVAMKDRQLGEPLKKARNEALQLLPIVDSENTNPYYKKLIKEQYRLAYRYPITPTKQAKYEQIKHFRDKELARCGKAFGIENIGKYYVNIDYYTDLREN